MKTALQVAKGVAAAVGFDEPSSLNVQTDPESRQMLSLLNRGCSLLAAKRGPFGESWPLLVRQETITTLPGVGMYALPDDFVDIIEGTTWDRTGIRRSEGPVSPQGWQSLRNSAIGSAVFSPRHRLTQETSDGRVNIAFDPIPGEEKEIVFEYVSRNWVKLSANAPVTADAVTTDSDLTIFPDVLVGLDLEWRMREANGLSYATRLAEFELELDRLFVRAIGNRTIDMSGSSEGWDYGPRVPDGNFGIA